MELKNKGYDVEIFDNSSLKDDWLEKMNVAMREFDRETNNWTQRLSNERLMQLDIYKLNKEWANMIKNKGYTIIDMGDFNNVGFSVFYAMEKSVIFK